VFNAEMDGRLAQADVWCADNNFYPELGAVPEIGRLFNADEENLSAAIIPLEFEVVGAARLGLTLLLAAVGVVLLIGCVNLANMMRSRIPARMREAAIRMALGATRWQLFRRMLTESLLLGVVGGALGVWLGSLGVVWLVQTAPPGLPRLEEVHMDSRVLWFAVALSLLTSILSGILPAWHAS